MSSHRTISEAYLWALTQLLDSPDHVCGPRGMRTRELVDCRLRVREPSSGPVITRSEFRNTVLADYLEKERRLYSSGELRAEVWAREASRFWTKVANPDGTINSNYGHLALQNRSLPGGLTPWDWAKGSLLRDPESRQAFVRFSLPSHQWFGNRDQVCTMHLNFLVRDGRLRATTVMRSCDVVKGLAYDAPWFVWLQERMLAELLAIDEFPRVELGAYTHLAHSLHLYERNVPLAEEMLGR